MQTMLDSINRIKAWASTNAPEALLNLQPPCTDQQLTMLRDLLPANVPVDLFEWFKLHNGDGDISWHSVLPDGMQFLNAEWLKEIYSYGVADPDEPIENPDPSLATVRGPVRPYWFGPLRVPFAHRNGEVLWVIDLDPGPGGKLGQIIYDDAEAVHLEVIGTSLSDLLDRYASALEQGYFVTDEERYVCSKHGRMWPNYAFLA